MDLTIKFIINLIEMKHWPNKNIDSSYGNMKTSHNSWTGIQLFEWWYKFESSHSNSSDVNSASAAVMLLQQLNRWMNIEY